MPQMLFDTLAAAENDLISQGFQLVPNTCNWLDASGEVDAGVYGDGDKWRIEYRLIVAGSPVELPNNATFATGAAVREFGHEAIRYAAAVREFADAVRPAKARKAVAEARRLGYKVGRADFLEAAVIALCEALTGLGYDEGSISRHVADPGYRDRCLYAIAS